MHFVNSNESYARSLASSIINSNFKCNWEPLKIQRIHFGFFDRNFESNENVSYFILNDVCAINTQQHLRKVVSNFYDYI